MLYPAAIISAGCFLAGVVAAGWSVWKIIRWPHVRGRVVRYHISRGDDGRGQPFFHPVVRFTTTAGKMVNAISATGWWRRTWPRGAVVTVRYRNRRPGHAEIRSLTKDWAPAATMFALAIFAWLLFV